MSINCLVCCEKFNKSNRVKIACNFCDYDVCISCYKQYIFNSIQEIHCMNCKKGWTFELIEKYYSKKFCKIEYREYRANILFESEKSMLPATQPYVEIEIKVRNYNEEINNLRIQVDDLYDEINDVEMEDISFVKKTIKKGKFKEEIAVLNVAIETNSILRDFINSKDISHSNRKVFIKGCPAENCKGFLSARWKCGICNVNVCNQCNEIKIDDQEHTCKEENILSMRLLAKDSKPCPKCASMIFKIEGCDQMYCVGCNTPFSWKSGMIVTGTIHNPHYYEYLRRIGKNVPRNPLDNPCNENHLINYNKFQSIICKIANSFINKTGRILKYDVDGIRYTDTPPLGRTTITDEDYQKYKKIISMLASCYQRFDHIRMVEMPRVQPIEFTENTNRNLRIKFMLNELTESDFKKLLAIQDKNKEKCTANFSIYQTLITVMPDLYNSLSTSSTIDDLILLYDNLSNLRDYINDSFSKIGKRYNCVSIYLDNMWFITSDAIQRKRENEVKKRLIDGVK